jgi:hypothetical protein
MYWIKYMTINFLFLILSVIFAAILYKYFDAFQQAIFWLKIQIQDSQQKSQANY